MHYKVSDELANLPYGDLDLHEIQFDKGEIRAAKSTCSCCLALIACLELVTPRSLQDLSFIYHSITDSSVVCFQLINNRHSEALTLPFAIQRSSSLHDKDIQLSSSG